MLPNGFILSNGLNFALVVLKLLMFKTCGIICHFKNRVFSFSGTERIKHRKIFSFLIFSGGIIVRKQ